MRHVVGIIIATTLTSGLVAFAGCSSSGSTGTSTQSTSGTGGNASSTSSTTSSSTTSSTSGTGGSGGAGGAGGSQGVGGAAANFACNIPSTPPSNGSCVNFMAGDAGEIDPGLSDAGDPSVTNCNPVTNAGCTGTDVCGPDFNDPNNTNYFCQPAGSPAGLPVCGDCSADTATCGPGGLCVGVSDTQYYCVQLCCTDADCGSGNTCDMQGLQTPLPSGVGICD